MVDRTTSRVERSRTLFGLNIAARPELASMKALPEGGRPEIAAFLDGIPDSVLQQPWCIRYTMPGEAPASRPHVAYSTTPDGLWHRLEFGDGTVFVWEAGGARVWANTPAQATLEDTGTYFLGPVLGLILRQRGTVCLHASGVVIDGKAIALVGPSGSGKSTTAAGFARRGYRVLTDDVLPVVPDGNGFLASAGYAGLRLWPAAVRPLFGSEDALPRITPTWDKRYFDLAAHAGLVDPAGIPLGGLVLLQPRAGDRPRMERCGDAREALMGLVANTYATRYLDRSDRAREFELLGTLLSRVAAWKASTPDSFDAIDAFCDLIASRSGRLAASA